VGCRSTIPADVPANHRFLRFFTVDYDKEVYNGDIGFVEDVDSDAGELTVSFDGRTVTYGFGELDALVPAYAVTIHRARTLNIRPCSFP
jgi:ATP-dependent exoDNAse (exonuclease V) alpha subunit